MSASFKLPGLFVILWLAFTSISAAQLSGETATKSSTHARSIVESVAEDVVNDSLATFTDGVVQGSDFTSLEARVGSSRDESFAEIIGVYRLLESDRNFIFNQTSVSSFDDRETVNTGLGIRQITEDGMGIFGGNVFFDLEPGAGHKRVGAGVEYLTSRIDFRANYYHKLSKAKTYKGVHEEALKGSDLALSYRLPILRRASLTAKRQRWFDGKGFSETASSATFDVSLARHLWLSLEHEKFSGRKADVNSFVSYRLPLSRAQGTDNDDVDTGEEFNLREKLYQPVRRENRIRKKSVNLGVTVGSY